MCARTRSAAPGDGERPTELDPAHGLGTLNAFIPSTIGRKPVSPRNAPTGELNHCSSVSMAPTVKAQTQGRQPVGDVLTACSV